MWHFIFVILNSILWFGMFIDLKIQSEINCNLLLHSDLLFRTVRKEVHIDIIFVHASCRYLLGSTLIQTTMGDLLTRTSLSSSPSGGKLSSTQLTWSCQLFSFHSSASWYSTCLLRLEKRSLYRIWLEMFPILLV